jgi:putative ABC transport system permease protein
VTILDALRTAFGALWANRLRSALTILGTVVGVTAVVAVVSITQGLNRFVARELLSLGSHQFTIDKFGFITDQESYFDALRRRDLRLEDARYLRDQLTSAEVVVPSARQTSDVTWRGREADDVQIVGLGIGYPALGDRMALAAGRHASAAEIMGRERTAVIGWDVAEQLFGAVDPLGQRIRIGRESFWIAGVLAQRGKVLGISQDDFVIIPITTFERIYGRRRSISITIKAAAPELYEACQEEATLLLKLRRGRQPWEDPDFGVQTSETYYNLYSRTTGIFYLGMIAIVGLSVIVGGIVMMNIMLVAVTERTREIGICKAVGARRRDIMLQYLVESMTLAGTGGILGVLLGAGVAVVVDVASPLPTRIEPWSVAASLTMALTVGLMAGLYPAARAARLLPVLALGYEK